MTLTYYSYIIHLSFTYHSSILLPYLLYINHLSLIHITRISFKYQSLITHTYHSYFIHISITYHSYMSSPYHSHRPPFAHQSLITHIYHSNFRAVCRNGSNITFVSVANDVTCFHIIYCTHNIPIYHSYSSISLTYH